MGLLSVDVAHDYLQSNLALLHDLTPEQINKAYGEMEKTAISDIAAEGLPTEGIRFIRRMDVRYAGQGFELLVDVPGSVTSESQKEEIGKQFETLHQSMYGHAMPGEALEVVSYRLRAEVDIPKYDWSRESDGADAAASARELTVESRRTVYFPGSKSPVDCAVYRTENLPFDRVISGPAIVEQPDTTTVVPPEWTMRMDRVGLFLERTG